MLDSVTSGLIAIANGLMAMLGAIGSPFMLAGILMVAAAVWLAAVELDEMNRKGTKPRLGRH